MKVHHLPILMITAVLLAAGDQDKPAQVYDEKADAQADIAKAVAKAGKDNKRVLVVYGGNWCGWCIKLNDLFKKRGEISTLLRNEYEVVKVDIGRFDKNMEITKKYEADIKKSGVPFITVLDGDGKVVTNQDTGALEDGSKHDPEKIKGFLEKWAAKPLDAEQVYKDALARAAKEKKKLLIHLGAPW